MQNKCYLCTRYDDTCHYCMLLCHSLADSPYHRRTEGSNAAFSRKTSLRGTSLLAPSDWRISGVTFVSVSGIGKGDGYDVYANCIRILFRLPGSCPYTPPLYYKLNLTSIHLSGYPYRKARLPYRAFFLLSRMLGTAAKLYLSSVWFYIPMCFATWACHSGVLRGSVAQSGYTLTRAVLKLSSGQTPYRPSVWLPHWSVSLFCHSKTKSRLQRSHTDNQ